MGQCEREQAGTTWLCRADASATTVSGSGMVAHAADGFGAWESPILGAVRRSVLCVWCANPPHAAKGPGAPPIVQLVAVCVRSVHDSIRTKKNGASQRQKCRSMWQKTPKSNREKKTRERATRHERGLLATKFLRRRARLGLFFFSVFFDLLVRGLAWATLAWRTTSTTSTPS